MQYKIFTTIALTISAIFFIAYTMLSHELYRSHQTRGDLTAYAQGMWNTLHGEFMASTYNYSVHNYWDREFRDITAQNSNIFGIHFNPILLLFLPLYAFFPRPETLLIIQAALTASGGLLIYLLARKVLRHEILALTIQGAYLLYFATVSSTLSQFHAYTLSLFFGPLLILASRGRSNLTYFVCIALFLLVQENTSLVAAFFGLYLTLTLGTRMRGMTTTLVSAAYFFLVIHHIIPALSPYHFYLFSGIYGSNLGGNIQEIIWTSLTNPVALIQSVTSPENLIYIRNLLIGIIPFAILSPLTLIVGFTSLAQNILSTSVGLKTQAMHYESGSVAFLFYALILGMSLFLSKTRPGKSRYGVLICIALLATMTAVSYKQFTSLRFNPRLLTLSLYTPRDAEMDSLVALIPPRASVSTQDYLSGHLASRALLYQFPVYADRVDYLILSKGDATWPLTAEDHANKLASIQGDPSYQLVNETPHFVLIGRVNNK